MLCEIMKASGDVPKSNYCKVLSQKCRQVFKPLARVMLRALIVLFDVISHHEQRNPSYMINCAVFKTPCMLKSFFSCCHQKKKKNPSHLQHEPSEALYCTVFYCVRFRGWCLWKEPRGSLLPSKAGGLHKLGLLWHSEKLAIPHSGTTVCCSCTTGATFQLGELKSCLM